MVEEKVYCQYEGEHSQRHLEESRWHMASRIAQATRGEKEKREGDRKRPRERREPRRELRDHGAKMTVI